MKNILTIVVSTLVSFVSTAQFSGTGTGTDVDPYIIATPAHLDEVRNDVTAYYELGNDIDLTFDTSDPAGAFYNAGAGWDPISSFTGFFNGGNFTIDGLFMNRPTEDYVALFGNPGTSTISNLNLTNVNIMGKLYVGALAGWINGINSEATIYRCSVSGSVSGDDLVGGLVGNNYYTNVIECFSIATVTASISRAGGLLGTHTGTTTNGLLNSYAIVNVTAPEKVGLLVGDMNAASITNSYAVGTLSGQVSFFPLYGASANSPISSSYWNGEIVCVGTSSNSSLSSMEMTQQASFANWDFSSIWSMNEGTSYPYLQWQMSSEDYHIPPQTEITPTLAELPDRFADCEFTYDSQPTALDNCGTEIGGTPTDANGNINPFPITSDGTTVITWTYEDQFGNVLTQDQNFIVRPDTVNPVPNLAELPDVTDECSVTLDAPTAEDACWGTIIGETETPTITNQGTTVVTWTFEDGEGNILTQEQTVIINDVTDPVPDAQTLDEITESCQVVTMVPPTATDNCLGVIDGTTDTQFPITAQGNTTVTWTFTDENGNSVTQDQTVTISDDVAPVPDIAELPIVYTACDGTVDQVTPPTATDNCTGSITSTTNQVFPFTATVDTQILWEYDDGNGNSQIQFQDVIVVESVEVSVDTAVCESAEFTFPDGTPWDGELLTQISTLQSQQGCDSTVTTNVTILTAPDVDLGLTEVAGCVGEELAFGIDEAVVDFESYTISYLNGSVTDDSLKFTFDENLALIARTQGTTVRLEVTGTSGCVAYDTVQLIDNTMLNWSAGIVQNNDPDIAISNAVLPETVDSFEWDFGDGNTNSTDVNPSHTYTENGTYTVTLTVSNECGDESTSQPAFTISGVCSVDDNSVSLTDGTLTATASGFTYQWIDCNTNQPINGETGQSFTPSTSGNYAVEISDGGCTVQSSCTQVDVIPLSAISSPNVQVYPNPATNKLRIKTGPDSYDFASIINAAGKEVLRENIVQKSEIDIENLSSGVYFIQLQGLESTQLLRFIKQ